VKNTKRHRHSEHCQHPKPHDGFAPGPPSTSRKRRRAIGHRDVRPKTAHDGPYAFLGAAGFQVKGPIVFQPPSPYQSVRNKYLQAPGFTMRRIA
jgi:hypothetical protein